MWRSATLFLIMSWILQPDTSARSYTLTKDTIPVHPSISSADSFKVDHNSTFLGAFSTSIIENKNWQSMDYKNYTFLGNVDYSYKVAALKFKKLVQFRGELGFLKFVDSTWYKNSDNLNMCAQWTNYSSKAFTHSYSIILKSQFSDTWKYTCDINGETTRKWLGGIMNPATLTIAYGLNYDFWKSCFINFAFATIKINARPLSDETLLPGEREWLRTDRTIVIREYGFSIQSSISKKIYENILWDNKTHFFTNGINKDQVTMDFQNRLTFAFPKYLQFRADAHIVYDPLHSYRLQYKQEVLVGISIEKKKEKEKKK